MAVVDPDRIGVGLSVLVSVEAGEHTPEWLARFSAGGRGDAGGHGGLPHGGRRRLHAARRGRRHGQNYDAFYKRLIAVAPMKNVTSRFAMERMKHTTAYPLHPRAFRDRRAAANGEEE